MPPPRSGRSRRDEGVTGRRQPRRERVSSNTRFDGCAFWAGSTKPTRSAIPMAPRLRPLKHGCAVIAGCRKRRFEIIAPPPINSSTGWPQPIFLWLRSGSPTSTTPSRTKKCGEPAGEGRCTITPSVFARSFGLPRCAAGARRAWPTGSCLHVSSGTRPCRTHTCPLSRGVGDAILRYIREVRPSGFGRALFFTMRSPIRPLDRRALGKIVTDRLASLGIVAGKRGTHALRHAAAQHLLEKGMSMKVIGDFLGHRDPSSTAIYAKVNLTALREVANLDREGLA